ncbi:MAG: excisionase [Thomasclavelia ramosa]
MNNTDVPIWEKYTLTIEEASKYFRIGEKKLRKLAEENIDAGWVIVNGNRIQIKRKQFERIMRYIGRNLMSLSRSIWYNKV